MISNNISFTVNCTHTIAIDSDVQSGRTLLIEPLRRAIEANGPEVALLVRARNNIAGHRRDATELGVTIYGDSLNHAKGVIAPRRPRRT
jgi:hypothetical protein